MTIKWTLSTIPISKLKAYKKNPRYIKETDFKQLQKSIAKFGLIDKPIVNKNFSIIGGHQRVSALKLENAKSVECWFPDRLLDEKEVEELNVRLNRNSGSFDWDILGNEFEMRDLLEWGFNSDDLHVDLQEIMKSAEESDNEEKEKTETCPECKQKLKSKRK